MENNIESKIYLCKLVDAKEVNKFDAGRLIKNDADSVRYSVVEYPYVNEDGKVCKNLALDTISGKPVCCDETYVDLESGKKTYINEHRFEKVRLDRNLIRYLETSADKNHIYAKFGDLLVAVIGTYSSVTYKEGDGYKVIRNNDPKNYTEKIGIIKMGVNGIAIDVATGEEVIVSDKLVKDKKGKVTMAIYSCPISFLEKVNEQQRFKEAEARADKGI